MNVRKYEKMRKCENDFYLNVDVRWSHFRLVVDVLLISILSLNIYPFVEMIKMLNQLIGRLKI